jgi:phosphate transport system substrate-binding protein
VNTSRRLALASVVSLSLLASACGDSDSSDDAANDATTTEQSDEGGTTTAGGDAATTTEDAGDGATTTVGNKGSGDLAAGDVFVTGSSTVEPISTRVSELADTESGGALKVTVEGPGTGDGFKLFCGGEADVTGASRPIKDEEKAECDAAGVEFVELQVGIDGLTIATNPNNTAVECLDVPALYALVGPESEGFENWSDANPLATELGSKYAPLPDAPLTISGPGEESGTYDSFVEFAIADLAEERTQDEATRADYTSSANDNLIVEGIEGSDTSLGWVGYAFYKGEGDKMKAISVADDAGACVAPTDETIADGSYPFSRDLFIYVNTAKASENPAVASYVDLYLSDEGIASVADAGYVAEAPDKLEEARAAWAAAAG